MSMKSAAFACLPLVLVAACTGKGHAADRAAHPARTPAASGHAVPASAKDGRCDRAEGPAELVTLLPRSAADQVVDVFDGGSLQLSVHLSSSAALTSVHVSDPKVLGFLNPPRAGDRNVFLNMRHPGSVVVSAAGPGGAEFSRRFVVHC